ncbi:MAG: hypothetical protein QOE01_2594 [Actinomycetota bacterium]|nr:hypothetical protein [Actinomycetota bacterium]
MPAFNGFSAQARAFYRRLEADNTREFWTANKAVYETEVREPLEALLADLEPEFGAAKVFRPYRDVRFSRDKTPYKTHQAALVGGGDGMGWYLQLDADGLLVGGGFRAHSSEQLAGFRQGVDDEVYGPELERLLHALDAAGFRREGETLKTAPKGYAADHPRVGLLRHKSLMLVKTFGVPRWLATPAAADRIRESWNALRPLNGWVSKHVAGTDPSAAAAATKTR